MKYYSLYKLLMFFEHQVKTDFKAIKKIYGVMSDDTPDDEARDIVHSTLRACGMVEEGFEEKPVPIEGEAKEIIMEPGTRESLAVYEQFQINLGDKVFNLIINLN